MYRSFWAVAFIHSFLSIMLKVGDNSFSSHIPTLIFININTRQKGGNLKFKGFWPFALRHQQCEWFICSIERYKKYFINFLSRCTLFQSRKKIRIIKVFMETETWIDHKMSRIFFYDFVICMFILWKCFRGRKKRYEILMENGISLSYVSLFYSYTR